MQYKTITLSLIQSHLAYYRKLKATRRLMETLEKFAHELRERHLSWTDRLEQLRPQDDQQSRHSAALDLAIAELEQVLIVQASASETAEP